MRWRGACAFAAGLLLVCLACGGGSGTLAGSTPAGATGEAPASSPTPAPSATPTPVAEATPTPQPTESPEINDNDAPVDHVGAGVYYVDCNGEILPNSKGMKDVEVGCRVHLDATPKDADNVPTNPRYPPRWSFSAPGLIEVAGSNPLGPIISAKAPHQQRISVEVDGVQSNTFTVTFH